MKDEMRVKAEALWALLDDISTASDIFKPNDEKSYKAFYRYAIKQSEKRSIHFESDGYSIFTEKEMKQINLNKKLKKCKACTCSISKTTK